MPVRYFENKSIERREQNQQQHTANEERKKKLFIDNLLRVRGYFV